MAGRDDQVGKGPEAELALDPALAINLTRSTEVSQAPSACQARGRPTEQPW